jgi:UDP-N-acetylmuramoyl-tripeptide--D-alanyl-D-alanine ligase
MPVFDAMTLARWCGGTWDPHPPGRITAVSNDTRTLKSDSLYVALRGASFDGHAFVDQAFLSGACGAVVESGYRADRHDPARPLLRVDAPLRALADMATGHRMAVGPRVIAVTGSAGKSTVKEMIAQILSGLGPTAFTRGNWNNEIGLPLSLLSMEADARFGVYEIGTNHPGEIARLCRLLKPDWGVVTNVGPVHLEHFGSVRAIAQEKAELFRHLPADGLAFVNLDTDQQDVLRGAPACRIVTISFRGPADYRGEFVEGATDEAVIVQAASGQALRLRNSVPGHHNITNAAMAFAVARECGLEGAAIRAALGAFVPLPMRWEEQSIAGGLRLINDAYNANPLSMRAVLDAMGAMPGRAWLVLGGMLELGAAEAVEHRAVGSYASSGPWSGIITVGRLGDLIAQGVADGGWGEKPLLRCRDNDEAAAQIRRHCRPGEKVLLKASRGMHFEQIAQALINAKEG